MSLNVTAKLGLDGTGFQKGLEKAGQGMKGFADHLGSLKGLLASVFSVAAIKSVIDYGSHIKDTSQRLGITTDAVQELSFAAEQSGSNIDELALGIEKISRSREAIKEGGEQAEKLVKVFAKMGVSFDEIFTNSPDELFRKLSKGLEDANVAGQIQAGLFELMGRGAGKLVAVMKELNSKVDEFRKSGGLISKEDVEKLDDAGDKLNKAEMLLKKIGAKGVNAVGDFASFLGKMSVIGPSRAINPGPNELRDEARAKAKAAAVDAVTAASVATGNQSELSEAKYNRFLDNLPTSAQWKAANPEIKMPGMKSDSLLSVGNFLGASGRTLMDSPAKETEKNTRELVKQVIELNRKVAALQIGGTP